jgi:polysaccharide biosynthesis transport protein
MDDIPDNHALASRSVAGPPAPLSPTIPANRAYGYGSGGAIWRHCVTDHSGIGAKLFEYWRIFRKRKWVILSVAAACLTIGILITLIATPLYTATVRLQIDRNVAKIVEGGNITPTVGATTPSL